MNLAVSAVVAALGLAGAIVYWATPQPTGPVFCYNCDMPKAFFGLVTIDELFLYVSLVYLAGGIGLLAFSSMWLSRARAAASEPRMDRTRLVTAKAARSDKE